METSSARPLPFWLSPLVLVSAWAYLASRWEDLPDRWIVHWGPAGNPNGWAARTPAGVYGLLVVGTIVWALTETLSGLMQVQARTQPQIAAPAAASRQGIRVVSVAVSLLLAFLAIELPLGHPQPGVIVPLALGWVFAAIVVAIWLSARAFRLARDAGAPPPPPGYHGAYYYNRENPSLWVPKVSGVGATINFAHPWAWPMLALILALPLAVLAFALKQIAR
jgi:uncharacterized membrane protein